MWLLILFIFEYNRLVLNISNVAEIVCICVDSSVRCKRFAMHIMDLIMK